MHTDTTLPRLAYTVAEVAAMIGRSKKVVYGLCARGELRKTQHVKGGTVYITAESLDEWSASTGQLKDAG